MMIRIFAYCVMDNHYHLVLENSSGRMSDFLKLLNGQYGMYYRKMYGGKGYVFQSRFKSTIIENDGYLIQSIEYLLQNPVRAGIVPHAGNYIWSSFGYYFSNQKTKIWEFKNIHGVNFDEIDTGTWTGKRLRGELLVLLKDKAGLKYKEISEISVFSNLSFTSLRDLYRRTRKRVKERR